MNKLLVGACVAALVSFGADAASFNFSETFELGFDVNGDDQSPITATVTGSFTGTRNGNLIIDIGDIAVSLNGIAFTGPLYASRYDPTYGFRAGGGVVSLDGTQNNFLFIDRDYDSGSSDPYNYSYTNFFYSVTGVSMSGDTAQLFFSADHSVLLAGVNSLPVTHLVVTEVGGGAVPEPASWALMLGGFGMIGGALRSRRRAAVSFG